MIVVYSCKKCLAYKDKQTEEPRPVCCGAVMIRVTPEINMSLIYEKLTSIETKLDEILKRK